VFLTSPPLLTTSRPRAALAALATRPTVTRPLPRVLPQLDAGRTFRLPPRQPQTRWSDGIFSSCQGPWAPMGRTTGGASRTTAANGGQLRLATAGGAPAPAPTLWAHFLTEHADLPAPALIGQWTAGPDMPGAPAHLRARRQKSSRRKRTAGRRPVAPQRGPAYDWPPSRVGTGASVCWLAAAGPTGASKMAPVPSTAWRPKAKARVQLMR
jgi:hypothetical protein